MIIEVANMAKNESTTMLELHFLSFSFILGCWYSELCLHIVHPLPALYITACVWVCQCVCAGERSAIGPTFSSTAHPVWSFVQSRYIFYEGISKSTTVSHIVCFSFLAFWLRTMHRIWRLFVWIRVMRDLYTSNVNRERTFIWAPGHCAHPF